jgi:hypothetical protein
VSLFLLSYLPPSGKLDHRLADPIKMGRDQITQVFAADHLRDEQEQILWLQGRKKDPRRPKFNSRIRVDRERGVLTCRDATQGEVLEALGELRPNTPEGPKEEEVSCKVSKAAKRELKMRAARENCAVSDLLSRALYVAGLIGD